MSATVFPGTDDVYTALRSFIQGVLGSGVEVIKGLGNRAAMPPNPFVAMTALFQRRLTTNQDSYTDLYLNDGFTFEGTAGAVGNVLTVSAVTSGVINVGDLVGGALVPLNTYVLALGTGTGGVGTYTLSNSIGFASTAITVTDGTKQSEMDTQIDIQLDFYGPLSGSWCAMIMTLFRDEVGCVALAPNCQPLYADEPRQIELVSGESQYIERWSLLASLQYNPVTTTGQQFLGAANVELINVDEAYPP